MQSRSRVQNTPYRPAPISRQHDRVAGTGPPDPMLAVPRLHSIQSSASSSVWSDDDAESMASTNATDAIPSLTRGNSIISSDSSAQTDQASSVIGEGFTLESHEGVLTLPNRYQMDADLLCPFQILDCEKVFADIVHFKMHVFSHFKGHTLPLAASCFLCDNKYSQRSEDDPARAWNTMLSHMIHDHYRRGQHLATVRADFGLMRWMYSRRLINEHQFKRTQLVPIPTLMPGSSGRHADEIVEIPPAPMAPRATPPHGMLAQMSLSVGLNNEPYTMTAGRRAERRQRDATRHMVRTRSVM